MLLDPNEVIYCPACGGQVNGPGAVGHEIDCELRPRVNEAGDDYFTDDEELAEELDARTDMGPGDHFEGETGEVTTTYAEAYPFQAPAIRPINEIVQVGKSDLAISADATIEQFREMERIKASLLRDANDWHSIDGRMVPSANGANKLIPPFGINFEIVSKNEHGERGVRRERTTALNYETHLVQKEFAGKGGGKYKKWIEERTGVVTELPMDLYTVTIRATDRWGRMVEMDSSVSTLEEKHAQSDHKMRSITQTRAQKRALIRLVGGVDANFMDDEDAGRMREHAAKTSAVRAKKEPDRPRQYALRPLFDRAVALGLARDRASFLAFVSNTIPGCASCINGKVTPEQSVAINDHLTAAEAAK